MDSVNSSAMGSLNAAQMLQQNLYDTYDTDGDGQFSLDEFIEIKPADAPSGEDLFGQMDSDGDGFVSQDEFAENAKDVLPPPPHPQTGGTAMMDGATAASLLTVWEEYSNLSTETDTSNASTEDNLDEQIKQFLEDTAAEHRAASGAYDTAQERMAPPAPQPRPMGIG